MDQRNGEKLIVLLRVAGISSRATRHGTPRYNQSKKGRAQLSGCVRFRRGPFDVLLATIAALSSPQANEETADATRPWCDTLRRAVSREFNRSLREFLRMLIKLFAVGRRKHLGNHCGCNVANH